MDLKAALEKRKKKLKKTTTVVKSAALTQDVVKEMDEQKYYNTILDFNLEEWIDLVRPSTAPTELLEITIEDANIFMNAYTHVHINKKTPDTLPSVHQQRLKKIEDNLQKVIKKVKGNDDGVFIKTSSRSAKNASAASKQALSKQYRAHLARVNNSSLDLNTKVICLLRAGTDMLQIRDSKECIQLFFHSERIYNDFSIAKTQPHRFQQNFVVRKWMNFDCAMEFRCWVVDGKLTAISQYSNLIRVPQLVERHNDVAEGIKVFIAQKCANQLAKKYPRYIVDVGFGMQPKNDDALPPIHIIELNPYLPTTDPGLFDWAKDRMILHGEAPFEFRFLNEPPFGVLGHLLDDWKDIITSDISTASFSTTTTTTTVRSKSELGYDLVVLGGGSGGSGTARRAAGYGAKVCIIERGVTRDENGVRQGAGVGGTCVNVGCVPKKVMFMASQHREMLNGPSETATGYGFSVSEMKFDWNGLKQRRDKYIQRLNGIYDKNWSKAGIDVKIGFARFTSPNTVEVALQSGGTVSITGKHFLIAVGGYPNVLPIPGAELAITSDGFFDLEEQPKKVAVCGAGYIAVEMAGIFNGLGTDATIFCRGHSVLRYPKIYDSQIIETLNQQMELHGPKVVPNSNFKRLDRADDGTITVTLQENDAQYTGFDCILFASGRTPATAEIGLDLAGVKTNKKGLIIVDPYENTNVPNIYALGDATTTGWELTPVAIAAGRRLADRLFGGEPLARLEYETIPTVIFSHPPIGMVGLTQAAAEEKYGKDKIKCRFSRFSSMFYAFNSDKHKVKTAFKLVLMGEEEVVVGLHIIGPMCDEILQGFGVAVKMGATMADLEATVAIHPTSGEELVTFGGWGQKDGKPRLPPQLKL